MIGRIFIALLVGVAVTGGTMEALHIREIARLHDAYRDDKHTLREQLDGLENECADLKAAVKMQATFLESANARAAEWLKQRNLERAVRKKIGIWIRTPHSVLDYPDRPPPAPPLEDGELNDVYPLTTEYRARDGYWELRHLQGPPEA